MAGPWDVLQIGATSLSAQQLGLRTVANNIANASTDGYNRQEVRFSEVAYPGGVTAQVRTVRDQILGRRLDDAAARSGAADAQVAGTANLEAIFTDTSGGGLGPALSRFFGSWQKVSSAPGDLSARAEVIDSARALAGTFSGAAQRLQDARADADGQVATMVTRANSLIQDIAHLNGLILQTEAGGQTADGLRDQRYQAQRELSTLVGTTGSETAMGQLTVIGANGVTLVQGSDRRLLETSSSGTTGMLDVTVTGRTAGSLNTTLGGALGATLALRDSTIPALQTQLDSVASSLITSVNALHTAGYGLDGVTGRAMFGPAGGGPGSAISMAIDPAVALDPRYVAASQSAATVPGDNRIANAISALETAAVASGGTATLSAAVAAIKGAAGEASSTAQDEQAAAQSAVQQLEDMRQSESGVSVEEQMTLLVQYQRAYQAAMKVISTADQMLETLINNT